MEYKYGVNQNYELEQAQQKQREDDAAAERYETIQKLRGALHVLTDNERRVITARYLLDDGQKKVGLVELGQELGMSAEAVRKTEIRAFKKLRNEITK